MRNLGRYMRNTVAVALVLGTIVTAASAARYSLLDLGTLGGSESKAYGINSLGQVVGYAADTNNDFRAFMWDGAMHDLGSLAGFGQGIAYSINGASQIVGTCYNYGDLQGQALLWLNGASSSQGAFSARAINASGSLAGFESIPGTVTGTVDHACVLTNNVLVDLGTLGGLSSYAFGLNAGGEVVGQSMLADDSATHACLWSGYSPVDLGTLGGQNSAAYAINDLGQVAGYADTASGVTHACMMTTNASGQVIGRLDLGALGAGYSYAYAINSYGQIVGTSGRAFVWQNGQMSDLNSLIPAGSGWLLASANGINDRGQIVGWGLSIDGKPRAFLLTPIGAGIAGAKTANDKARVDLPFSTVTAVFDGFFYVEQDNRTSGLRVVCATSGLTKGQRVAASGVMETNSDGERYLLADTITPSAAGTIAPLEMTNLCVGGATSEGQQGVDGGRGVNNIGLLVTTTGRVTSVGADYFYIDDGSAVTDGLGSGIRVLAKGLSLPVTGSYLRVTGISSCLKDNAIHRLILPREQSDIIEMK